MLWSVIYISVGVYVGLGLLLFFGQSRFIYFPDKEICAVPKDIGLEYEEVTLNTQDGLKINAWFIPASNPRGTILFCHGNAGNISHRLETIQILNSLNLNILIFDYRGYGKSEGHPTERGTYLDAESAYKFLLDEKKIPENKIIIMGRSLGAPTAAYLITNHKPQACILESSFTSLPDFAAEKYPVYPVRLMARFGYKTIEYVRQIKCPVLIVHSPEDEIIPYSHGKKLFDAANEPKEFLEIHGSHNRCFFDSIKTYKKKLDSFINSVFKCSAEAINHH